VSYLFLLITGIRFSQFNPICARLADSACVEFGKLDYIVCGIAVSDSSVCGEEAECSVNSLDSAIMSNRQKKAVSEMF